MKKTSASSTRVLPLKSRYCGSFSKSTLSPKDLESTASLVINHEKKLVKKRKRQEPSMDVIEVCEEVKQKTKKKWNSYTYFSNKKHKKLKEKYPSKSFKEIVDLVAKEWKTLNENDYFKWYKRANKANQNSNLHFI